MALDSSNVVTGKLPIVGAFSGRIVADADWSDDGGWSATEGTDLWDELDEWPHDGSTSEVTASAGTSGSGDNVKSFTVGLENPDGSVDTTKNIRAVGVARAGVSLGFTLLVREGGVTRASGNTSALSTGYSLFSFDMTAAEKNAVSNWDDVRLRFRYNNDSDFLSQTVYATAANMEFDL